MQLAALLADQLGETEECLCLRMHSHLAHLLRTTPMYDCPSSPVPPLACTHIAPATSGLSAVTSCTYVITSKCSRDTPENNRENKTLHLHFGGLFCAVLVIDAVSHSWIS